jgi:hypothetical protein
MLATLTQIPSTSRTSAGGSAMITHPRFPACELLLTVFAIPPHHPAE